MTAPWVPGNETEEAMAAALAAGDRREFFTIVTRATLYLPALTGANARGGGQRFVTTALHGQTYLPVFTSVAALAAQVAGAADGYTMTSYAELRAKWPSPEWRLALNPGSPLDAFLTIDAVQAAADGDLVVPRADELITAPDDAAVGGPIDQALSAAVAAGDMDRFVETLLDAWVVVPTSDGVADVDAILAENFPWRPAGTPELPMIEVFTSVGAFSLAYPEAPAHVAAPLTAVLVAWPSPEHTLAINPGTPLAVTVPGDQVGTMLLWSHDWEEEPADETASAGSATREP